jgi:hypothetical protein
MNLSRPSIIVASKTARNHRGCKHLKFWRKKRDSPFGDAIPRRILSGRGCGWRGLAEKRSSEKTATTRTNPAARHWSF